MGSDRQNAWSIYGNLLFLGHPASPAELASAHATPDYILHLCGIPDSPLHLTTNSFVTISTVGYFAIMQFINNIHVGLTFTPDLGFQFHVLNKRRRTVTTPQQDFNPIVKRRKLNSHGEEENRRPIQLQLGEHMPSTQTYLVHDRVSKYFNITLNNPFDTAISYKLFEERHSRASWLITSNTQTRKTTAHSKENTYTYVNGKCMCTLGDADTERTSYFPILTTANQPLNLACLPEVISDKTVVVGMEAKEVLSCNTMVEQRKKFPVVDDDTGQGHSDDIAVDETSSDCLPKRNVEEKIPMRIRNVVPSLGKEKSKMVLQNQSNSALNMLPDDQDHLQKSQSKQNVGPLETLTSNNQTISKTQGKKDVVTHWEDRESIKRENKPIPIKQNICDDNNYHEEKKQKHKDSKNKSAHVSENNQLQDSEYPKFESYIVEAEEGSGGYGTVYRARRKTDGLTFAIKYPHVRANKNHIQNEVKMLERFGGKNFIIDYEGSFRSGDSHCLVLEHVDHDRPEVLKREIDINGLQWYGFCMFKSLAFLHKQGIVHRDVKPGNFLFSRKASEGYLIDFNLALDLHQKYGVPEKTKSSNNMTFNIPSATRSLPLARNKQSPSLGASGHVNPEAGKQQKPMPPKNLKRKAGPAKVYTHGTSGNIIKSHGADGSVITSTKEATSNRSVERFREPIPCPGRKEYLSLVQEAFQGTNSDAVHRPTSKRKRVAATPGNGERKFVCVTPMPLHSIGVPVAGAGLLKNKDDVKQKREGPCVGTKGFRAPEVLVRSIHQGQKVDIWSAGVTLLYLMIGRAPFSGDPDQNIKEIAKLKGTEDLWEVAKLHNRESSFPSDLFDIKLLRPINLLEWCKLNTRRPDLFGIIPASLFDLVDKCLTVNPRLRISAEEALGHAFFAPCHDFMRNYRLQKQGLNLESGIS